MALQNRIKPPFGEQLNISNCQTDAGDNVAGLKERKSQLSTLKFTVDECGDGGRASPSITDLLSSDIEVDGDGDKENIKKGKKKTRGTRGGRKNREKREIRENRQKEKLGIEQLKPIKKEIRRQSIEMKNLKYTTHRYTPDELIEIRDNCCNQLLRPPLVLAPIEKQGVGIFPVEYLPLEEMSKAKREGKAKSPTAEDDQRIKLASKIEEVILKVREMGRKPVEGRLPYFVQRQNSMEKAHDISSAIRLNSIRLENHAQPGGFKEVLIKVREENEDTPMGKIKWPMRPPKTLVGCGVEKEVRNIESEEIKPNISQKKNYQHYAEWANESAYSGMYCLPNAPMASPYHSMYPGMTWGIQYYPVVYAPVYPTYVSPPLTSPSASNPNLSRRSSSS